MADAIPVTAPVVAPDAPVAAAPDAPVKGNDVKPQVPTEPPKAVDVSHLEVAADLQDAAKAAVAEGKNVLQVSKNVLRIDN